MIVASCDRDYVSQPAYLHRDGAICCGPVPKLPVIIIPPRPHCPVRFGCYTMVSPGGYCRHIAQTAHLRRKPLICRASNPQLTVVVVTPAPQAPIRFDCQAVVKGSSHVTTNLINRAF